MHLGEEVASEAHRGHAPPTKHGKSALLRVWPAEADVCDQIGSMWHGLANKG